LANKSSGHRTVTHIHCEAEKPALVIHERSMEQLLLTKYE